MQTRRVSYLQNCSRRPNPLACYGVDPTGYARMKDVQKYLTIFYGQVEIGPGPAVSLRVLLRITLAAQIRCMVRAVSLRKSISTSVIFDFFF